MVYPLSSETWPKRGTLRNGTLYERPMSGRRMFGSASSSWPTPDAHVMERYNTSPGPAGPRPTLAVKFWPTVTAQDAKNNGSASQEQRNTPALNVLASWWQTPTAENAMMKSRPSGRYDLGLRGQAGSFRPDRGIVRDGSITSKWAVLNPRFVEALMGFPDGWTDCTSSATASYRSWRRLHLAALRRGLGWTSEGDE